MASNVLDPKESKGYTIVIYTDDHWPPHVHVRLGIRYAKIGFVGSVYLIENKGLSQGELRDAIDLIWEHRGQCWAVWVSVYGQPTQEQIDRLLNRE